jgi:hypothetical protein
MTLNFAQIPRIQLGSNVQMFQPVKWIRENTAKTIKITEQVKFIKVTSITADDGFQSGQLANKYV